MSVMLGKASVDIESIINVLGGALYSTPQVVVRELIQNGHDSIVRRLIEEGNPRDGSDGKVTVEVDSERRTLSVTDNGAGMTDEEIRNYLAVIGSGKTRTFRGERPEGGLIGYFGLGFLSAYVVANKTEVWTCSMQEPEQAWYFSTRSGQTFTIEQAAPRPVGTRVVLHLKEEYEHLSDHWLVWGLVQKYCCLLRIPVYVGGELANDFFLPWQEGQSSLRRRILAKKFADQFAEPYSPICAWEFEATSGEVTVRGVFWIHGIKSYASNDQRSVSVFVRGMQISDEERELLPAWAGFIGCVLECDSLNPTASRESLKKNRDYDEVISILRNELVDGISNLPSVDPVSWKKVMKIHNETLLGAALCDDRLFDVLCDELTVPTDIGNLRLKELLDRSGSKIHISHKEKGNPFEALLLRALKVPVVTGSRYAVTAFCRKYANERRGEVVILGTREGDAEMLRPETGREECRERLQVLFGNDDCDVVLSRFSPEFLPFLFVRDREQELKREIESCEVEARIGGAALRLARQFTDEVKDGPIFTLHLNANSEVVQLLLSVQEPLAQLGAQLLAPLIELIRGPQGHSDIEGVFREYSEALTQVLEGGK